MKVGAGAPEESEMRVGKDNEVRDDVGLGQGEVCICTKTVAQ